MPPAGSLAPPLGSEKALICREVLEGERELAELSPQARLALELQRVAEERRSTDWRQAAAQLEALDPRWSLDALLAGFGAE